MMPWVAFIVLLGFGWMSEAAEISKISGSKVMIKMEGKELSPDETVFAYKDGKKKAMIKITKVKEGAALGEVTKGSAEVGMIVAREKKGGGEQKSGKSSEESKTTSSAEVPSTGNKVGVIAGLFQNTMKIEVANIAFDYTGTSMMIGGFVDIPFSDNIDLRGKAGYLQYAVAKDNAQANLGYLSLEGSLQLYLTKGFWLGGGGAFLLTVARDNNIPGLDASSATNSFFFLGLGYNISLDKNSIIPISFDYILFPGGTGVSASSMAIRAGYGWAF